MKFRKHTENQMDAEKILKEVSKCKPEELEALLQQIENKIEKSDIIDRDLLMAKTITTSRIASIRTKNI